MCEILSGFPCDSTAFLLLLVEARDGRMDGHELY